MLVTAAAALGATAAASLVSAGTLGLTAGAIGAVGSAVGGGLAAGAIGAGLGAGTAALTGGDVGKGALMGGVGGALTGGLASGIGAAGGAAAAGTGASTAIGAGSGAAGGAAAAAAGGEDPLKGALMGGVAGGIGGYAKGIDSVATPAADTGVSKMANQTVIGVKNPSMGYGSLPNSPAITNAPPASMMSSVGEAPVYGSLPQSNLANVNPNMSGLPAAYTPTPVASATPSLASTSSGYLQKGIDLIKEHPAEAMQIGGAGINMLSTPQNQQFPQGQPINTTNYLSPNFQRYEATPTYADGGSVGYEPSVTMYGGAADGYADGGMLGGMPGAGMVKGIYNAGIGGSVAPGLKNTLFGKDETDTQMQQAQPQQAPQQAPQGPMNPIVAKAMAATQQVQQAEQAQQAQQIQPVQAQPQAQPITPSMGIAQPQIQPVGMASGGITDGYNLGGYAHGGIPRLLSGEGDGVDDQIPATIGEDGKQPARLANNEFVIPARAVSELGNGSSEAGGKILQQMVDRVQARRAKTIGKGKIAVNSKAVKDLPA
jgi:hypothetical protein